VVPVAEKPCCAAEAFRRVRQVEVGGVVIGITMLDDILREVREMNLSTEKSTGDELLKRVKVYNYVPPRSEGQYRTALVREYRASEKRGA
jgi:hypothetical protein